MGIGKIGTTIGKEIIAWTKTGKSLLATKPIKVNTCGLKIVPITEDIVQFNKFSIPAEKEITSILRRHSITGNSFKNGTLELDKSFINDNNSIFLRELDRMFPVKQGEKNIVLEDILVCLEDINHSGFTNKKDFLSQFIEDLECIKRMTNTNGEKLFDSSIESLYSMKSILQAKYNNPERYQEIMDLYKLTKSGKAPDYIIKNLIPEARFHKLAKSDIECLKSGKNYFQRFSKTTSHDDITNKTELGEVISIDGQMYVRGKNDIEKLKLDEEMYKKLFPALGRYCLSQVGDSCYFVSALDGMIKNPETRIDMYKMFEQIGKHKVRVKLPKENIKPVEFNLSDISEFNDEYVHGALGYKLIEKVCMQNYNGLSRTVQDFNRGGQPQIIMDVLYKDGAKQGCYSDLGKNGLHMFVERSKGNTVLIPRTEYQETSQNRNIGLWGGHCYSSQNGNFFNPVNSIEEVYYPKQENIYQIIYRQ